MTTTTNPWQQLQPQPPKPDNNLVTLNVGGRLFQTTSATLSLAGPNSLLSTLSPDHHHFIDRDPDLFSPFLSLLRTGFLPTNCGFSLPDLVSESRFYGLEHLLSSAISDPSRFDPFSLEPSAALLLNGRDSPSAISTASPHGSVHVAHGSKITSFDWSLTRKRTVLTHFTAVDSLLAISSGLAAAGATDFSGLQVIDLEEGSVRESLNWENVTRSGSTVQAIGSSTDSMFVSFESGRRNSNAIVVYDLHSFTPVTEIAHNEIFGADLGSAIPATKLIWIPSYSLLMASGSHGGPSGVTGNVRLWDLRSGNPVWEIKDTNDCFADVCVSDNLSAMFKVGVNSGEVYLIDLRKLNDGGNESWECLGDVRRSSNNKKEGGGCKIKSHGNHVFCTKKGKIELLSEVVMVPSKRNEDGVRERVFRKNAMGSPAARDVEGEGNRVSNLAFGGNKMFVTRKDKQMVEVWQSSSSKRGCSAFGP
ncbi:hypothetical protein MLD38_018467 [Melastoma candidum]|uniref:Uncharacterized protein n=1 Tax=Melastoma candidum TaxID=119954 RepID=A0ACB9QXE7_9MYRT|nr:hypothetical protein MLD38_018467 [Melastoma candidum]